MVLRQVELQSPSRRTMCFVSDLLELGEQPGVQQSRGSVSCILHCEASCILHYEVSCILHYEVFCIVQNEVSALTRRSAGDAFR